MASNTPTNYWKYKQLNTFAASTFTLILMQPGFVFDKDTQEQYADISASEVANGSGGYVAGTGVALTVVSVTQDNTNDMGIINLGTATFTPTGADVAIGGAFVYDVTDDILCGYFDAEGVVTIVDGQPYLFNNIRLRSL